MTVLTILIPTVNDGPSDFQQLFAIRNQLDADRMQVRFDFSRCQCLRPNAVAFLGGCARLVENRRGTVTFDWDSIRGDELRNTLCQNGFASAFGNPSSSQNGHSIPYREDREREVNAIMDYLTDNWIGKGWLRVSARLRDEIAGRMWEIYGNAFEHSSTSIGVFSCGQHFEQPNELILTVVDFGRGIPTEVRAFFGRQVSPERASKLSASKCLEWAFGRGNTTSTEVNVPRGLGLDLLKEFVSVNRGKMEVYSNEGYAVIDKNGEQFKNLDTSFEGTVVHITLRCDETRYYLRSEAAE